MAWTPASVLRWLFDSERGASGRLLPRWLFLRALGLIYYSAFFSLVFQIRGLIGPQGILPANRIPAGGCGKYGRAGYWYAPTLLWFSSGSHMLTGICWAGMIASLLLVLNFWPRGMLVVCFVCFLSFVSAAQEFSGYQSDGMLLEAGFIALFFAPAGFRPGWGEASPPSRASLVPAGCGNAFASISNRAWRRSWAATRNGGTSRRWTSITRTGRCRRGSAGTCSICRTGSTRQRRSSRLALELVLVWAMFLPRRIRIACFFVVTVWQIGIILSANYTFLNYLVLVLGFLLLDDNFLLRFLPRRWKENFLAKKEAPPLAPSSRERNWRTILRAQAGRAETGRH